MDRTQWNLGDKDRYVHSEWLRTCRDLAKLRSSLALLKSRYINIFYEGEELPKLPNLPKRKTGHDIAWGSSGKDAHVFAKFRCLFSRMEESCRALLLFIAQKIAWGKAA